MGQGQKDKQKNQTGCILCILFVVFIVILLLILYFTLFKPRDPSVQVIRMQLLSLSTAGGGSPAPSVQSLSLDLQVSMYNPNRADFYIEQGSTACLFFQGSQVALASIPTGLIFAQSTVTASIAVTVLDPIQLTPSSSSSSSYYLPPPYTSNNILPLATSVTIMGHVTTANIFSHHSNVVSKCNLNITIAYPAGSIQSYTCMKSYSLDD